VSKRKFIFLTKWDKHDMKCACLQMNPCCDKYRECEEIELTLNPFDDIEECIRNQKAYIRTKGGALKQR
jgi:hypothetical protein